MYYVGKLESCPRKKLLHFLSALRSNLADVASKTALTSNVTKGLKKQKTITNTKNKTHKVRKYKLQALASHPSEILWLHAIYIHFLWKTVLSIHLIIPVIQTFLNHIHIKSFATCPYSTDCFWWNYLTPCSFCYVGLFYFSLYFAFFSLAVLVVTNTYKR